jgi:acetylornithine deacetylase/succinyl-diaminopimelate desuccinylase-like protein
MPAFLDLMRKVIDDPAVEVVPETRNQRPGAAPSRIDSDAYRAIESAFNKIYGATTLPMMSTGATDMAYLRAKGIQCYGVGAMTDLEDPTKGFGPHSDQERILEESLYKHVQFFWTTVTSIAGTKR